MVKSKNQDPSHWYLGGAAIPCPGDALDWYDHEWYHQFGYGEIGIERRSTTGYIGWRGYDEFYIKGNSSIANPITVVMSDDMYPYWYGGVWQGWYAGYLIGKSVRATTTQYVDASETIDMTDWLNTLGLGDCRATPEYFAVAPYLGNVRPISIRVYSDKEVRNAYMYVKSKAPVSEWSPYW